MPVYQCFGSMYYCVDAKSKVKIHGTEVFQHDKSVCYGEWQVEGGSLHVEDHVVFGLCVLLCGHKSGSETQGTMGTCTV